MSTRPQRERQPPERLQNNQARNVAAAAARAAARPKTVRRAVRPTPKGKNIQPQPKRKLEAKNAQSRVLTILDELSKGKNPKWVWYTSVTNPKQDDTVENGGE